MNHNTKAGEELHQNLVRSMVLNGDLIRGRAVPESENRVALLLTEAVERATAKRDMEDMRKDLDSLLKDRDNALKYGVTVLGTAVAGMVAWMFHFFVLSKSGH